MQKGIIFLLLLAAFGLSIAMLINMGARLNTLSFWVPLILLPAVGYFFKAINFKTDD